jgi:hypothetical protein
MRCLFSYGLEGAAVRLYPLIAPHLGVYQQTPEGQWPAIGADNHAWVDPTDSALFAYAGDRYMCLLVSSGFKRGKVGSTGFGSVAAGGVAARLLCRQLHQRSKPGSSRPSRSCPLPSTGLGEPSKPRGSRSGLIAAPSRTFVHGEPSRPG